MFDTYDSIKHYHVYRYYIKNQFTHKTLSYVFIEP